MRTLRAFVTFWYDFIVGDDWMVAVGIVLALAATAMLAHTGSSAWWLMPVAVIALLVLSLVRAIRRSTRTGAQPDRKVR